MTPFLPLPKIRVARSKQSAACGSAYINREALCAAPPEARVHSPSQTPLSCPVAPLSQRELHKDGDGGGGGVARRARAARALKAKSYATCETSSATSSATSCAASFTCLSFTCHLREGVGGGALVLGVGSKAALAADRASSGVGLASGSPRAAVC